MTDDAPVRPSVSARGGNPSARGDHASARYPADTPQGGDVRDLLLRISRELVGTRELSELLQTMVDAALQIVPGADKCVIHLLDSSGSRLEVHVCSQPSPAGARFAGFPRDVGVAGRALAQRETIYINDTQRAADYAPLRSGPELRSLLVAPLYVADADLGTLSLSSAMPDAFRPADAQLMRTLAAQASVAIHQARLYQAAVDERERSDAVIDGMADGLVMLDGEAPHRRVVRLNPAVYAQLELPDERLSLPCALSETECPSTLRQALDPGAEIRVIGPYSVEVELPSGARPTFLVLPSVLKGREGGEVRVFHDVTLEREAARSRALFVSQIAHELRTPLQHILGFTSLLKDVRDLPRDDAERFLAHVEEESHQMARLVDDLVELSRIETGRFSIQPEHVDLYAVVAESVGRLTPRAHLAGVELGLEAEPLQTWVLADPMRLHQVLANLISNAIRFEPEGGGVKVQLERRKAEIVVHVADTGPGIPLDEMPHVFKSFYQGSRPMARRSMGLGLYISQEIINALGGTIWVRSSPHSGTTFSFGLPYLKD